MHKGTLMRDNPTESFSPKERATSVSSTHASCPRDGGTRVAIARVLRSNACGRQETRGLKCGFSVFTDREGSKFNFKIGGEMFLTLVTRFPTRKSFQI